MDKLIFKSIDSARITVESGDERHVVSAEVGLRDGEVRTFDNGWIYERGTTVAVAAFSESDSNLTISYIKAEAETEYVAVLSTVNTFINKVKQSGIRLEIVNETDA